METTTTHINIDIDIKEVYDNKNGVRGENSNILFIFKIQCA
jgi:hypothetical protein